QLRLVDRSILAREAQARATRERLEVVAEGYVEAAVAGVHGRPRGARVLVGECLEHRAERCHADARCDHRRGSLSIEEEMAARRGDLHGVARREPEEGAL